MLCACTCECASTPGCHLVFGPQQVQAPAVDGRADEVQAVVWDAEVQVAEAEHEPVWDGGLALTWYNKPRLGIFSQRASRAYWLVVQDVRGVVQVEVLLLQDVLKLINAVQGVVHVGREVTVEEAHHVAIEGKTHRHSPFIPLRRNTQFNSTSEMTM